EPAEAVVDGAHVELEARPVVLAGGDGAVEQFGGGGTLVRLEPSALAEPEERVRLFRAARDQPARAVVLERTADHHLPGAEQRRGQRVAGKPLHAATVEGEIHRLRAVDQAAAPGKTGAHV